MVFLKNIFVWDPYMKMKTTLKELTESTGLLVAIVANSDW